MDILSAFPGLIDGFVLAFLSTQDGTLDNMPEYAKIAFNKVQNTILEVINSKIFKMPDLTFHEMEYLSISWIKQDSLHLTNDNILAYSISLNHKPLFDFINTNTIQTEMSKIKAFSQLVKSIDKINDENKEYFLQFIRPKNSKFLLPINVIAYASGNINGIKFLEEEKLNVIIDNIIPDKVILPENTIGLYSILPVILENTNSPLIKKYKNYLVEFEECIVKYNRLDLIKYGMEKNYNLETKICIVEHCFLQAITEDTTNIMYILDNPEYVNMADEIIEDENLINLKYSGKNINIDNIKTILKKLKKLSKKDLNVEFSYLAFYNNILSLLDNKYNVNEELQIPIDALVSITTNMKLLKDFICRYSAYDISNLLNKIVEENKIDENDKIFEILIGTNNIISAAKWILTHKVSDKNIVNAIETATYKYTITNSMKHIKIFIDNLQNKKLLEKINFSDMNPDLIIEIYNNCFNDIEIIPNVIVDLTKRKSKSYNLMKAIVYLSTLV
jgi:hypothetical protein